MTVLESEFIEALAETGISRHLCECINDIRNVIFENSNQVQEFDDDLAAKFADTTRDITIVTNYVINKIKEYAENEEENFIQELEKRLNDEKSRFMAALSFKFADMGVSEDFEKTLPPVLHIIFANPNHSSHGDIGNGFYCVAYTDFANANWDGCAEDADVTFLMYEGMLDLNIICKLIRLKLPHELRHVVDACNSETLDMMEKTLTSNVKLLSASSSSEYFSDPGERYARMTEICSTAMELLSRPDIRNKFHSAEEVVEKISGSKLYSDIMGDAPDDEKRIVCHNLKLILEKIMDKLI